MAIHMFGPEDCVSTARLTSCQTWLVYAERAKSSTVKLYVCQTWRLVALDLHVADVCLDLVDANHCKSLTDCTKQLLGFAASIPRKTEAYASKESESYLAYPPSISSHTSQKRTGDIGTGLSVNFCDSWEMVTTSRGLQLRKPQTGGGRTVLPSWESWGKHCIWTFEIIETLQVPRSKLKEELLSLRRSGYTLLGVEQTHTSVPLDQHWT